MTTNKQSLHITIKEPPKVVRSLGVFQGYSPEVAEPFIKLIESFLRASPPKDIEFVQNTREEIVSLILNSEVLGVQREGSIYTITVKGPDVHPKLEQHLTENHG
jgi:hypothetical protein